MSPSIQYDFARLIFKCIKSRVLIIKISIVRSRPVDFRTQRAVHQQSDERRKITVAYDNVMYVVSCARLDNGV